MIKENCLCCLFAVDSRSTIMLSDLTDNDNKICDHPNSPMYNDLVNENKTCRLYIDEKKYFEHKDRIEKINKLKDKIRFNKS